MSAGTLYQIWSPTSLDVARLQIEPLRDGEVDPGRRIAAQRGVDRAPRLRSRLLEQRRREVIDAGTDLLELTVAALTCVGIDLVGDRRHRTRTPSALSESLRKRWPYCTVQPSGKRDGVVRDGPLGTGDPVGARLDRDRLRPYRRTAMSSHPVRRRLSPTASRPGIHRSPHRCIPSGSSAARLLRTHVQSHPSCRSLLRPSRRFVGRDPPSRRAMNAMRWSALHLERNFLRNDLKLRSRRSTHVAADVIQCTWGAWDEDESSNDDRDDDAGHRQPFRSSTTPPDADEAEDQRKARDGKRRPHQPVQENGATVRDSSALHYLHRDEQRCPCEGAQNREPGACTGNGTRVGGVRSWLGVGMVESLTPGSFPATSLELVSGELQQCPLLMHLQAWRASVVTFAAFRLDSNED